MSDGLWIRELTIRRMPGFPTGGIGLSGLTRGVNLVRGPNASGKTTTARAIHLLLWPDGDPRVSLSGRLRIGETPWLVDVDGKRVQWQRDGETSPAPALPPGETRGRYFLSLHELLQADDRDLADLIRVESAGGYDVPGAAEQLEFGAGGPPRSLVSELRSALEARDAAVADAERLREERRRLDGLHRDAEELRRHAGEVEALRRAIEVAEARSAETDAEVRLATFPDALESMRDHDASDLEGWSEEEETLREELAVARSEAKSARARIESVGFTGAPPTSSDLRELERRREEAREIAGRIERAREERAAARAARTQADAVLDSAEQARPSDAPARAPAAELLDRLDRHLRRSEEIARRRAEAEAEKSRLEDTDSSTAPEDLDRLLEAQGLLRSWLRTGGPSAGDAGRKDGLILASSILLLGIGVGALVLSFTSDPLNGAEMVLGALALIAGVVVLVLRPRHSGSGRESLEREATRLGHAPERWAEEAVRTRLEELERAVARSRLAEVHRTERAKLEQTLATLDSESETLRRDRGKLAEELGFELPLEDLSLHVIGTRLVAREAAARAEMEAQAALDQLQDDLTRVLERARELLEPFGYEPSDVGRLSGDLEDLRDRSAEHEEATGALEKANEARERIEGRLEEIGQAREALWSRLALQGADRDAEVARLARRIDDYRSAVEAARTAARVRETAEDRLRAMAEAGDEAAAALLEDPTRLADTGLLQVELAEAEAAADRAVEVREEMAGIERALRDARRKHDVEDAIAAAEEARARLEARRMQDVEAEVGATLAAWVRARSSDHNRPAVFHRARELFAAVTRGRYELRMSDNDRPAFRALDTGTRRGHSLEELSAGTRLQLLLSVRIAFVETLESGAALPLLLDEVLANCDDHRARAIIDAAVALARTGRQVFYFTAQADELAKWREVLEGAGVEWTERDLTPAGGSGHSELDWTPRRFESSPPPDPAGRSHEEYGRALGVPPVELWPGAVEGVHLWYLLDDPDLLCAVLSTGIRTWGQLQTVATRAGDGAPRGVRDALARARGPAAIVHRLLQLLQRGRGQPVDRAVLLDSGAVSDRFIDEVSDLASELGGSGKKLIAALEANRVPGFWSQKTEELRDFLTDRGYVSREEPLPDEEILLRLTAEAHRVDADLDRTDLQALMMRVAHGAASPD